MATTSLQQQTIADTATNWSQTLDFQQFDPSLGALTGVAVGLTGDLVGSILLENLDLAPATFGVGFKANVEVNAPDSSSLANVAPVANSSVTLAPGAGATLSRISGSASTQVQYQASAQPSAPAVGQFIGTRLVPLSVGAQSSLHLTGPGMWRWCRKKPRALWCRCNMDTCRRTRGTAAPATRASSILS
jgi:hypothetical protein